jgi:hypothetical protein
VVKKKIKKKTTIKKADGKITIKKKVTIKKVTKKKGGEGNNVLPKKIRELQAGLSTLQTQVDTIELTPSPMVNPVNKGPLDQQVQQVLMEQTVLMDKMVRMERRAPKVRRDLKVIQVQLELKDHKVRQVP